MKDFLNSNSVNLVQYSENILTILVVIIGSFIAAKIARGLIRRANNKVPRLDETVMPVLTASVSYLVYLVGFVIILDKLGVDTTSIIAVLGSLGLAVGFALKDTLSNIAAGIMLLIIRPFKVGDGVETSSATGTVKEIHLFTTTIHTFDGVYVSAPNSSLWGASIKNFSKNPTRRIDIVVGISYSDSIEKGLEVLKEILKNESRFLEDPVTRVMVVAMADSSVNLQLRGWVKTEEYWDVLWDLNHKVKIEIEKAGLSIPFPQRDVHMHQVQ